MEREAFRQRMQQYKQARESNPQLKYWDWKKYADGGEVRDNTYKKAALQFKNLDDYIKWLNTMPLADNGNINEIENYNFA